MDSSTPGFPVLHHLLKCTWIHVHWAGDAIWPSPPLSSPSPLQPYRQQMTLLDSMILVPNLGLFPVPPVSGTSVVITPLQVCPLHFWRLRPNSLPQQEASPWEAFCCSAGLIIAPEPVGLTETEAPPVTELWGDQWYPWQWCFHGDRDLWLPGVTSANGMSCQQADGLLSSSALLPNTQLLLLPSPLPSSLIWFDVSAGCDFSKLLLVNRLPSAGTKRYQLTLGSLLCSTSEDIRENWRLWFQPISPVSSASHPHIRKVNKSPGCQAFP